MSEQGNKIIFVLEGWTEYETSSVIGVFDDDKTANEVCEEMKRLREKFRDELLKWDADDTRPYPEWKYKFPEHDYYGVNALPLNDWDVKAARRKRRRERVK